MDALQQRYNSAAEKFENWLANALFPKWCKDGFDKNGAALERFTEDGLPDWQADKRIRVQARQIFSLCYGQKNGFISSAPEQVAGINQFIDEVCADYLPGFYPMVIDANNKIKKDVSDLYDIAFFFLAFTWQYDVLNDTKAIEKANALATHLDEKLAADNGGWLEGTYAHDIRRQNPHMHLFEAFMNLFLVTKDDRWKTYANRIFDLFKAHFYDAKHGVIIEYFTVDWAVCPDTGDTIEPGHMMEWVWLLNRYQEITGTDVSEYCDTLYSHARQYGLPEGGNWLIDAMKPDGSAPANTSRCWPMTEWIKAALVMKQRHPGQNRYLEDATFAIEQLMAGFQHPARSEQYIDSINIDGEILDPLMPASSLYHICMAHYEAKRAVVA